ncbi:MAG: TIGR03546 family protein [Gammaproteobacteria bacterium]|nr:TIGR03546 family protein [Gammaproteobacteria bacterium]
MFSQIIKLFRVLSSETSPMQISSAFALSMVTGLTPLLSLHNLFIIFLIFIFRVNVAAFLLGTAFFSAIAYLLDPAFHQLGHSILTHSALTDTWTALYNITTGRLSGFNNTIVMGSLAVSLIALLPVLIISNILIKYYRQHFMDYLNQSRLFRLVKSSKILTRLVSMAE